MTPDRLAARALAFAVAATLMLAGVAGAQGHGHQPGGPMNQNGGSASVDRGPVVPVNTFRQFGAWLDDATSLPPGQVLTGIGFGSWRTQGGNQFDVPMVDVLGGVMRRVQVSATVPFYRTDYGAGAEYGLDDVYLGTKVMAVDPSATAGGFGLAVGGIAEITSPDTALASRLHWAVPIDVEVGNHTVRAYGSAGYFSRGAVFTGAALEVYAPSGTTVTGALTQSYSTQAIVEAPAVASSRQRVDLTASVSQTFGRASAYVSIGRSLSAPAGTATTFALSGGMYVRIGK